jgi:ferric-dicitrate binding protein FerR (iron transport regulator)
MDQTLVASIRKSLEAKPTEELRQAYQSGDKAGRSPEELEAMRQLLDERRNKSNRVLLALGSAVVVAAIAGAGAWWQSFPAAIVCLSGVVGAILGFASWYIPDLMPRA